ncbi:MAG: hypothetical protein WBS54_12985 [Acidobacteriota bacterium]
MKSRRRTVVLAALALSAFVVFATAALAGGHGCCAGKAAAAGQKGCCAKGAACPQREAMQKAFGSAETDLAQMEKGIPAGEQEAFLKAHEQNLSALMAAREECVKSCAAMKGGKMAGKGCPYQAAMQGAFKSLESDLAAMKKGVPAADQAAFLKSHEQNLKKLVDARAECMKSCPMNMKMKAAGGTT